MTTALVAILVFGLLVLIHELGHFTVAKLVGIKVHEFAIGMGPKLGKFKRGETEYSIRALPIGGYVKMEGEDEESDDLKSFNKKPIFTRMAVLAAGAIMNFILAFIVFSIISFAVGSPTTTIAELDKELPAYEAGLQPGDKITAINDKTITNWDQVVNEINTSDKEIIKISIARSKEVIDFSVKPIFEEAENRLVIGIIPEIDKNPLSALKHGFLRMVSVLIMMIQFFKMLFMGKVNSGDLMGPVGVISLVGEAAKFGFLNVLYIAGIISINLGFFNLLPIPALDGSRIMFLLIELVRGKPINPEKEGFIHLIGFALLISLMLFITYKDVIRLDLF